MDSSSAAHRRPCQRQPTWEVEESPRGLGGVAQSIACWTQSIRAGAKKIVNDVANAGFRLHSGACDVLLVRHAEGMRSSPWHVHLGRDTCSQDAQHRLRLEIAGMEAPLTMMIGGDKKGFFDGATGSAADDAPDAAAATVPFPEHLAALQPLLRSGCNHAALCVEVLDESSGAWTRLLGKIPLSIFVWDATDQIVVADVEGVLVNSDLWSKSSELVSDGTLQKGRGLRTMLLGAEVGAGSEGRMNVREGVGPLLSYLDRAGYRVLLLKAAPITRADRVREMIQAISKREMEQWGRGAAVPACPILTTQARMGSHLLGKLADTTIGQLSGDSYALAFRASVMRQTLRLFQRQGEDGGGEAGQGEGSGVLCGAWCQSLADARVYEGVGVPAHRVFVVDAGGGVMGAGAEEGDGQARWVSFVEMYPSLQVSAARASSSGSYGGTVGAACARSLANREDTRWCCL